jgi:putative lipoprotein
VSLKKSFKFLVVSALCLAGTANVGCSSKKAPDPSSTLSGTLVYREEVKLSPNAVAYVRLADITDGNLKSTTVLQRELHPGGELPIPFELSYKDKWINPSHEYSLEVRIVDQGKLQFISSEKQPVITNGHPSTVAMVLERPGRR